MSNPSHYASLCFARWNSAKTYFIMYYIYKLAVTIMQGFGMPGKTKTNPGAAEAKAHGLGYPRNTKVK